MSIIFFKFSDIFRNIGILKLQPVLHDESGMFQGFNMIKEIIFPVQPGKIPEIPSGTQAEAYIAFNAEIKLLSE